MNKLFYKISQSLLIIMMMTVAFSCKKDGNPNKLPDADISPSLVAPIDGYIRILAIGNSFSEDEIESHLYELAKVSGKTVIIGNHYIGGASLEFHKSNIENNREH